MFMKTVLLVEDSEDDLALMKMACHRTGIPHSLQVVMHGDAAVDYLSATGAYSDRSAHPLPDLIFLDIKLPRRSGHEVLEWIRAQPGLVSLPIVVLTGSDEIADVNRAYKLGATSYLNKMAGPAELGQAVRIILKYWLQMNVAPSSIRSHE